ncbi:hypothetical protein HK20_02165 [Acetobacter sp. DsW_54]|nr:hypothetical protein HK20_02165 [Acetobacter sp. DsW_54]
MLHATGAFTALRRHARMTKAADDAHPACSAGASKKRERADSPADSQTGAFARPHRPDGEI